MVRPNNERGLPAKNYDGWKNSKEKDRRKTENDVIGLRVTAC